MFEISKNEVSTTQEKLLYNIMELLKKLVEEDKKTKRK